MKKLISTFLCLGVSLLVAATTVQLPATLDKSNVSAVSDGMTYYNTTYFQLNPSGSSNPTAWAEWNVNLSHSGKYIVTENGYYTNGHQYLLELRQGGLVVSSYTTKKDYTTGENSITHGTRWDLSSVATGTYTIRVKCSLANGKPNLKSIDLEYDGEILPDPEPLPEPDPNGTSVNYTADNTTIFPNPERGFITMLERTLDTDQNSHKYNVKGRESYLTNHANNDKGSLILLLYYLDNYKNTGTLPSSILSAFDEDMQVLRNYGMKAIVRFAYTKTEVMEGSVRTAYDAPLNIVQKHIAQYKSHWAANADVIFCFQMGLVGAYGEWYYTNHFGNQESHMNADRNALVDTMLAATPKNRCVQIRTPLFKTEYMEHLGVSKTPILYSEAYNGSPKSRLGHHNDAFLYHADNMGTYNDTAVQKPWLARETFYVPIGGESDITDTLQALEEATHEKTIAEMSRMHWTFIQSGYSTVVTGTWRKNAEHTFDELNRRLGYRYQLVNGTYTNEAAPGGKMSVYMNIRNAGFAPLYNERPVYIVLKNNSHTYTLSMSVDPRRWRPNGVISTVSEVLDLPSDIANGTYQLYLYMPDYYESLRSDSKFAIRFANTGSMWDATTGMNALGASITISGSVTPPPAPLDNLVTLPATLDKSNVNAYSDDMTWYGTGNSYFDFGPEDNENIGRWAEWNVKLTTPEELIVTEEYYCTTGRGWKFALLNPDDRTDTISVYNTGDQGGNAGTASYATHWDLSSVPAGEYILCVRNVRQWAQPKLKSLMLESAAAITTYTVTWNATANGGTCATATSQINIGAELGTLPTATKSGYVFIGWFSSASGGSQIKTSTKPASNVTYYAQFLPIPQLSSDAVDLPATLNKANVGAVSDNMQWYNVDYFDIGPGDATNLYSWAAWRVHLQYPSAYTVTEETNCSNGHQYIIQLFDGNTLVSEFTTHKESATGGDKAYEQATPWDLSSLPVGNYVLTIRNVYAYSQPKLKRLTLYCEVPSTPTGIEQVVVNGNRISGPEGMRVYDIAGRDVTAAKDGLNHGTYIIVVNSQVRKVLIP